MHKQMMVACCIYVLKCHSSHKTRFFFLQNKKCCHKLRELCKLGRDHESHSHRKRLKNGDNPSVLNLASPNWQCQWRPTTTSLIKSCNEGLAYFSNKTSGNLGAPIFLTSSLYQVILHYMCANKWLSPLESMPGNLAENYLHFPIC